MAECPRKQIVIKMSHVHVVAGGEMIEGRKTDWTLQMDIGMNSDGSVRSHQGDMRSHVTGHMTSTSPKKQ